MKAKSPQAGFTILELLIAIAIMAGVVWLGGNALMRARGSKMRDASALLASQMRFAFDRSLSSGKHHRMVIQLDENRFWVEECRRKMPVRRGIDPDEEREREEKAEEERKQRAEKALEAAGAEASSASSGDEEDEHAPPAQCGNEEASMLEEAGADAEAPPCCRPKRGGDVLSFKRGVQFAGVDVAHLTERVSEGDVRINFFPMGYAEKTVVFLADHKIDSTAEFDQANPWSVTMEPLTGRVRTLTRPPKPEEGGRVHEDATGEEAEDDE